MDSNTGGIRIRAGSASSAEGAGGSITLASGAGSARGGNIAINAGRGITGEGGSVNIASGSKAQKLSAKLTIFGAKPTSIPVQAQRQTLANTSAC